MSTDLPERAAALLAARTRLRAQRARQQRDRKAGLALRNAQRLRNATQRMKEQPCPEGKHPARP